MFLIPIDIRVHISNAEVDMYCYCDDVFKSRFIFRSQHFSSFNFTKCVSFTRNCTSLNSSEKGVEFNPFALNKNSRHVAKVLRWSLHNWVSFKRMKFWGHGDVTLHIESQKSIAQTWLQILLRFGIRVCFKLLLLLHVQWNLDKPPLNYLPLYYSEF